jgi:hypothetical protein
MMMMMMMMMMMKNFTGSFEKTSRGEETITGGIEPNVG